MTSAKVNGQPRLWNTSTLTSDPYAILLLNQPIQLSAPCFQKLWNEATFRICVDGGTNQLNDFTNANDLELLTPDLITGDFDSILPVVKTKYEKLGAKIIETEDQNFTDFTKALKELFDGISRQEYPTIKSVLVINEPSGRHDQFFANIVTLSRFRENPIPIFIQSEQSLCWILCQGSHSLQFDTKYIEGRPFCGLIPLHGKTKMTTVGLRWNLDETMECSFSEPGIVSTSNEITSESLEIKTDHDILWTMKSL